MQVRLMYVQNDTVTLKRFSSTEANDTENVDATVFMHQ
jgi:hypothetical protein